MNNSVKTIAILITFLLFSCEEKKVTKTINKPVIERVAPQDFQYIFIKTKDWLNENGENQKALNIILSNNRLDETNLRKTDTIVVPDDLSENIEFYMPFPKKVSSLEKVNKIIIFSYATQAFATYVNGILTHVGPTSMGREKYKTPTGLFFTNWKAKKSISTSNDEWILKWNFNIENKLGIGFHEYTLPGYPASHSCLRLLEKDAKMLYNFADQWILENYYTIAVNGTPVIVFGNYDFEKQKPWYKLTEDSKALMLSEKQITEVVSPYLDKILIEQQKRENYQNPS